MSFLGLDLGARLRGLLGRRRLRVYHDAAYRLPLSSVESQSSLDPRRADLVSWYLLSAGLIAKDDVAAPPRAPYADLARVHTAAYLESLGQAETLAKIFAVDPSDVQVDELLGTLRLATGATVEAAAWSLASGQPALNLLGGFHHAARDRGAGFCAINDVAVAVAVLRAGGFAGRVVVLDLDAHPPDGTADCLSGDAATWIGSLSGSEWGPIQNADETVLRPGASDQTYLAALDELLGRMPRPELVFVLAGGDVLAGDRFGQLGLSLAGVRRRDHQVAAAIAGRPQVWLPAGGYRRDSWRVLADTALVLLGRAEQEIPASTDPLADRFASISLGLFGEEAPLSELSLGDLEADLGFGGAQPRRLLGFYTAEGIEYGLFRYGFLSHLERLGYDSFRVAVDGGTSGGDRVRVYGRADDAEHILVELVAERRRLADEEFLYIHWLTLRHPRARFSPCRPQLPGQEVPGLGLARESGEILLAMARRLGLAGVAFRPAWYHMAYVARFGFRFADARLQGEFEAMMRDFQSVSLLEASLAVAEGRVRRNRHPYTWDPSVMFLRLGTPAPASLAVTDAVRAGVRYAIVPREPQSQ